jgi:hypothetical protein
MTLSALGIFSAAGAGGPIDAFELIQTSVVSGSSTSTISFASLASLSSTYRHFRLVIAARTNRGLELDYVRLRFNGDTGNNYAFHELFGNGGPGLASGAVFPNASINLTRTTAASATANAFGAITADILDAYSTTKNTTVRSLGGYASTSSGEINLTGGVWVNTAAISSIDCVVGGGTIFIAGSRFSLYGIRG